MDLSHGTETGPQRADRRPRSVRFDRGTERSGRSAMSTLLNSRRRVVVVTWDCFLLDLAGRSMHGWIQSAV